MTYYITQVTEELESRKVTVLNGCLTPQDNLKEKTWIASVEKERATYKGIPFWKPVNHRDIAILKVDKGHLSTVSLGSSDDLRVGDEIFVIGHPGIGMDEAFETRNINIQPTVASGIVRAVRPLKSEVNTIQTDGGINPGNSGGPMFNSDGEVVGVATFSPNKNFQFMTNNSVCLSILSKNSWRN